MTTRIAISIGDVAGIGPEVIVRTLEQGLSESIRPVVFGDWASLRRENELLGEAGYASDDFETTFCRLEGAAGFDREGRVGVVDVLPDLQLEDVEKGTRDTRCARLQLEAFRRAVAAVRDDDADAVVTAPWNKSLFDEIDEPAVGHTDVLAEMFQTSQPVMMLAGPELRVALTTVHVPLRRVASRLTSSKIRTVVRTTAGGLRRRFGVSRPRIAVCGLNPHAGEEGAIGDEEVELIEPTVRELDEELEKSVRVEGPFPADTLFSKFGAGDQPWDAVVCMYHDQGLIPLKSMHFGRSANVTLGLPIVRTSVDHGTAYDIAGRGEADPGSMSYAIELAADMARRDQTR